MSDTPALELNRAVPDGRVELYAIPDEDYPGGWFYRFQYYHPDDGERLRYDNAHDDDDLDWHHRHVSDGEDTAVSFQSITAHVARFLLEVEHMSTTEQ
jgi:hypothetical protein